MRRSIDVSKDRVVVTEPQSVLRRWFGRPVRQSEAGWREVVRVTGGKVDKLIVDTVVVQLELVDGRSLVITEDDEGWTRFLETARSELPGFQGSDAWLAEVIQPAFGANHQVLFTRQTPEILRPLKRPQDNSRTQDPAPLRGKLSTT